MVDHKKEEYTKEEIEIYVKEKLESNEWSLHCIKTATSGPYPTEDCNKSNFFLLLGQDKIQAIRLQHKKGGGNEYFSYNAEIGKFKKVEKLNGF